MIQFERIKNGDQDAIQKIASWYFDEWKIPVEKTVERLSAFPDQGVPFQLLMSVENVPVATGGLYGHVGLLDVAPKFKIYGPWLALVLTLPEQRKKGHGSRLCEEIQNQSKHLGLKEIFLFTSTAESLYRKLGWVSIEEKNVGGRDVCVMKKEL